MMVQSPNASRFSRHPRRDPVTAGLFVEGTPHQHVARTIDHCESCHRTAVLDVFRATTREIVFGVPFPLRGQLPLGPLESRSRWWLCAECGGHGYMRPTDADAMLASA